jgi:hypothetical protein
MMPIQYKVQTDISAIVCDILCSRVGSIKEHIAQEQTSESSGASLVKAGMTGAAAGFTTAT